jgi:hypothetical protein
LRKTANRQQAQQAEEDELANQGDLHGEVTSTKNCVVTLSRPLRAAKHENPKFVSFRHTVARPDSCGAEE